MPLLETTSFEAISLVSPRMVKIQTNPISTPSVAKFDAFQFYQSPFLRTFTGYKFLSSTFLLCGTIAVPTLLMTGQQEGVIGAVAIGFASILPMSLQMIIVPRFVSRMRLSNLEITSKSPVTSGDQQIVKRDLQGKANSQGKDNLYELHKGIHIGIEYFSFLGLLKTTTEQIGHLRPYKSRFRWINWTSERTGAKYYVDEKIAGPVLRKIVRMMKYPEEPKKWNQF